jgi:hypothetical protein
MHTVIWSLLPKQMQPLYQCLRILMISDDSHDRKFCKSVCIWPKAAVENSSVFVFLFKSSPDPAAFPGCCPPCESTRKASLANKTCTRCSSPNVNMEPFTWLRQDFLNSELCYGVPWLCLWKLKWPSIRRRYWSKVDTGGWCIDQHRTKSSFDLASRGAALDLIH